MLRLRLGQFYILRLQEVSGKLRDVPDIGCDGIIGCTALQLQITRKTLNIIFRHSIPSSSSVYIAPSARRNSSGVNSRSQNTPSARITAHSTNHKK